MLAGGMADGTLECLRPLRKRAAPAPDGRRCRSMAHLMPSPQPCAVHLAGSSASGGGIDVRQVAYQLQQMATVDGDMQKTRKTVSLGATVSAVALVF